MDTSQAASGSDCHLGQKRTLAFIDVVICAMGTFCTTANMTLMLIREVVMADVGSIIKQHDACHSVFINPSLVSGPLP